MAGDVHGHGGANGTEPLRRLGFVLALTAAYALAEVLGGWLSNSLALIADAGHMLTDMMALSLALLAAWFARRPPDASRTYGYQRIEILAALLNGVALIVIALFIGFEAWQRIREPLRIAYPLMAGVAGGGLVVNLVAAGLLGRHRQGMNVQGAYLHVLGDLLGSVGTLLAAALGGLLGWRWADPAASAVIATIIIFSAVRLVLESVNVLLEGVPSHLETPEVREVLRRLPGVADVHDLHLWSLGGRQPLLTAHLVLDHSLPAETVLREAARRLLERFEIEHATLQLEPPDYNIIQELTPAAGEAGGAPRTADAGRSVDPGSS